MLALRFDPNCNRTWIKAFYKTAVFTNFLLLWYSGHFLPVFLWWNYSCNWYNYYLPLIICISNKDFIGGHMIIPVETRLKYIALYYAILSNIQYVFSINWHHSCARKAIVMTRKSVRDCLRSMRCIFTMVLQHLVKIKLTAWIMCQLVLGTFFLCLYYINLSIGICQSNEVQWICVWILSRLRDAQLPIQPVLP